MDGVGNGDSMGNEVHILLDRKRLEPAPPDMARGVVAPVIAPHMGRHAAIAGSARGRLRPLGHSTRWKWLGMR